MQPVTTITNRVRWEHACKRRYYEVRLVQDLWGDTILLSRWGQIGTPLGRQVPKPVAGQAECLVMLAGIARRRAAHGYVETGRA